MRIFLGVFCNFLISLALLQRESVWKKTVIRVLCQREFVSAVELASL